MAKARHERVKEILFFAFVVISLVLVMLIWTDGLRADAETVPGYYRSSNTGEVSPAPGLSTSTPAAAGTRATGEAVDEHSGPHRHDLETPTPKGRSLGAEDF